MSEFLMLSKKLTNDFNVKISVVLDGKILLGRNELRRKIELRRTVIVNKIKEGNVVESIESRADGINFGSHEFF
jgi:hypothetical protein